MIEALKEYKELCIEPGIKWAKKHWKGYCLFNILLYGICVMSVYQSNIKRFFKERFSKEEEES